MIWKPPLGNTGNPPPDEVIPDYDEFVKPKVKPFRGKLTMTYGCNRLEQEFGLLLEARLQAGELQWWEYTPLRMRIGRAKEGRDSFYTPDFAALTAEGNFVLYEVKGHWREAARVRIRAAAVLFPMFTFKAVTKKRKRDGGGWRYEAF